MFNRKLPQLHFSEDHGKKISRFFYFIFNYLVTLTKVILKVQSFCVFAKTQATVGKETLKRNLIMKSFCLSCVVSLFLNG